MYSGATGMAFEHSENPCQIRFVQKISQKGKSSNPGILAGYFGNIGIGTRTPLKKLQVNDMCTAKADAECANRKGQILMSASWRNVLMSKIQTTNYDMIGAYTNWGGGKSVVYLGAHDSQARPMTRPVERVYFGGVPKGRVKPFAYYENLNGKMYATKFVKMVKKKEAFEISRNADVFLETAHTAKTVDLAHATVALHAKTHRHDTQLADLQQQVGAMTSTLSRIRAKLASKL
jgi:hypothetical protein